MSPQDVSVPAAAGGTRAPGSGPQGNARLTAATGALLLGGFAAEGVTILFLGRMLTWHFFIGLALVGPVTLKIASTGYRAVRYYTGSAAYRRVGPPPTPMRLMGPLLVLSTVAVLATGILLGLLGRGGMAGQILFLHKASFLCWAGLTGLHVLVHIWRLPRTLGAELGRASARHGSVVPGRWLRLGAVALACGAGLLLADAGMHLAAAWRG